MLQDTTSFSRIIAYVDVCSAYLFAGMYVPKGVYREAIYVCVVAMVDVWAAGMVEPRGLILVNMNASREGRQRALRLERHQAC